MPPTLSQNHSPAKIAFCITELDIGGAERCLTELVTRIDRRLYEPQVYVLAPPPAANQRALLTRLEAAAVDIHFLGAHGWYDAPAALNRLTTLLRRQCPRLLMTFLFHANLMGRLAARLAGVPRVVCGVRVAERRHAWHLRLDRATHTLVDRYVCVSRAVARFCEMSAGLPPEKLAVIANGVDVERFRQAAPIDARSIGLPAGHRALLHVGRLDPQKRIDWLLQLGPQIMARWPKHDLVLVGRGEEEPQLRRMADQLGIGPRVHFLGFRDDIPQILRAGEVLLLSSAWEGMPNSVLEAMAAGLPVVATDVEGVRELLGPNSVQQCVAIDDQAAFVEKLHTILSDDNLRQRLGRENQRRAQAVFSIDVMTRSYEQFFSQVLARRPRET